MKLELLASELGKDATELSSTFKLEEGVTEVSPEIIARELPNIIGIIKKSSISEGKKQGEGMARRLVSTEIENLFSKELGINGKINEMVETLKTKLANPVDGGNEEFKKREIAYKTQISDLEKTILTNKEKFSKIETQSKVKSKLMPLISGFDFATDKVKEVAINSYLNNKKFSISENDIFIDVNGVLNADFDKDVDKHFSEFAKKKKVENPKPGAAKPDGTTYSTDLAELTKLHSNATTTDEKNAILKQMKAIMKK